MNETISYGGAGLLGVEQNTVFLPTEYAIVCIYFLPTWEENRFIGWISLEAQELSSIVMWQER